MSDKNPPVEDDGEVTVKDLFAAAALAGLLSAGNAGDEMSDTAADAFNYAHWMMKHRDWERAK